MEKVSVTMLKANLAHYVSKLKAGRSFVVTDRGIAVAVFEPVAWKVQEDEAMSQLVREGQVTPPTHELPDDFFERPRVKDPKGSLLKFLLEERECGR